MAEDKTFHDGRASVSLLTSSCLTETKYACGYAAQPLTAESHESRPFCTLSTTPQCRATQQTASHIRWLSPTTHARLGGGVDYVTHRIRHGQPATADPTRGTSLGPGGQKRLGYVSTCVEKCTKPIGPLPICRDLYRYRLYTAVRGRVGCCSFGAYCTSLFLVQETVDFRW